MSQSANVNSLFQSAFNTGDLSHASLQVLSARDVGTQIQAGLGLAASGFNGGDESILVSMMIDDSGSIRFAGNSQVIRDGHNLVLDSLIGTKQVNSIQALTRYLNGTILYPYIAIKDATRMDSSNFDPNGGTPLYDQSVVLLGSVLAKAEDFSASGIGARTITLIATDGNDEGSRKHTARDVASLVHDLLMKETNIVAFMGVSDGSTDFNAIAKEMGIPDEWILTPGNSQSEIRKAFKMFSQSAVRASQTATLSRTAMGGFGV